MSRSALRRKASNLGENNNGGNDNDGGGPSQRKIVRLAFQVPIPERPIESGRALTCGQGEVGQLGLGDNIMERKRPALVDGVENVVDAVAGGVHNLLVTSEGRLYTFGCNDEGALGRDTSEEGSEFVPAEVKLPGKVVKVTAGDSHSACILEDGRVFAWGSFRDSHGSMGLTLEGNKLVPIEILPGTTCADIASGADHLIMLTCSGKVYTLGNGEQGQLGRISMRSASGEGRRGKTDLLKPGLVVIKRCRQIDAIWATNYCSFLREGSTGHIWAFGLNNFRQLTYSKDDTVINNPVVTDLTSVKQISGGLHHTLVFKDDGSCHAIGCHEYGRLGLGKLTSDVKELQRITFFDDKKVVRLTSGDRVSYAITEDGKLYTWGIGSNLQLGTGNEDDENEPVLIVSKQTENKRIIRASGGGLHSLFLVADEKASPPIEPEKPALTKKAAAAAAAKEKEAKKSEAAENKAPEQNVKGNVEKENTNGKAADSGLETDISPAEEEKKLQTDSKTSTKRGRKKK